MKNTANVCQAFMEVRSQRSVELSTAYITINVEIRISFSIIHGIIF